MRFARGANTYRGAVVRISDAMHGCVVEVDGAEWTVAFKSVLAVEVPKLTEAEVYTLSVLEGHEGTLKDLRGDGFKLSARTLTVLEGRGLVQGSRMGAASSAPMEWSLTEEGRRVAGL